MSGADSMPAPLRDLLAKLEEPTVRWALVAVGVVVLLQLRLILFAAALPVMAYWHYSNQSEVEQTEGEARGGGSRQATNRQDDDYGDEDDNDFAMSQEERDKRLFGNNGNAGGPQTANRNGEETGDPYGSSFWSNEDKQDEVGGGTRGPPDRKAGGRDPLGLDDDFGLGGGGNRSFGAAGGGEDKQFDFLGDLGSGGGGGLGPSDFDFLGGGGGMDSMDFMGGFGGKGKGKGKGKSDGPREPNPKQVFVAGIADSGEDEVRMFFEDTGEVERLKVLRDPEGKSKGVCFVTFRTEEQAQAALGLHGSSFSGKNLTVRLAHGGNKGEKGVGKGGDRPMGGDRLFGGGSGGPRNFDGPVDLGGSERFGAAFGDDRGERGFGKGGGKGKSGGKGKGERNSEMDGVLAEALEDSEGPVKVGDFDFAARRFLSELRSRDKIEGTQRFMEAMDMVIKYTSSKERSSVRKWPAYVFTLLQRFDPTLYEELRERDAERRREKSALDRAGDRGDEPGPRERDD